MSLYFSEDWLWIDSIYGDACPLMKCPGIKKPSSKSIAYFIRRSFFLFISVRSCYGLFKKCYFYSCKFKSHLLPLPFCTYLQTILLLFFFFLGSFKYQITSEDKVKILFSKCCVVFKVSCLSV